MKIRIFLPSLLLDPTLFKLQKEPPLRAVGALKDNISSMQRNEPIAKLVNLRAAYDTDVGKWKEKVRGSEERAEGLHVCADLQSVTHKNQIETFKKMNEALRVSIGAVSARIDSEDLELEQELKKDKGKYHPQNKNWCSS